MINFLKETKDVLSQNGKTMEDVVWIGTVEVEIPIDEFVRLADDIEYEPDGARYEIATDLIVCGNDWYLERNRYDDYKQRWEFKTVPERPKKIVVPERIVGDALDYDDRWGTLKEMNHPSGRYNLQYEPFDWEGMEVHHE